MCVNRHPVSSLDIRIVVRRIPGSVKKMSKFLSIGPSLSSLM